MKTALMAIAFAAAAVAFCAEEAAVPDWEVWNQGVSCYEAGDVTNALRLLRPLMLSKTHGPRAAEVVAKLEQERGNLEEAAVASQIALRAAPQDAKANRNFTRATDGLPQYRETARINAILKASQGKDPGAMMQAGVYEARRILDEAGSFRTNAPDRAVALADGLSRRAGKLAETWIPVREAIAQSVTNEEQASTIIVQIEQAQANTKKAAEELGDLDEGAYGTASGVEHDFTRFFKLTAMPPAAIAEDEIAQSNAWQDVAVVNGRPWQQDALDYTRAFRAKFPAWARAYEQQAQADTNKPPFTAEAQAKVSALSTELEKIQIECAKAPDPTLQEKALDIIREIMELLPKDGGGGGQQNQQQKDQDKNSPNNDDRKSDDKQDPGQQPETPEDQDLGQQDENPQQEKPEDQKDEEKPGADESEEDKDVEALLKKALERSAEHEAEKKARMYRAPRNDSDRDW